MSQQEPFISWVGWCNQKLNCEVRYLDNRCEVKVLVSPLLAVDLAAQTITIYGKSIPFRLVLSVKPLNL
ncbi:MAG: hypothetical protein ACK5CL_10935 [Sphingomonadales bacterium]|jgi:hypothetical protein